MKTENKTNEKLIDSMVVNYYAYIMAKQNNDKYFDKYYECKIELLKRLNKEEE